MRVYLDNCINRPFDDQSQLRIQLEAEAKLFIQRKVCEGQLELAWSYILDYENQANPFDERQEVIQAWKKHAIIDTDETQRILAKAGALTEEGLKSKDALHIACAIEMQCDYFITTDDRILNRMKNSQEIAVVDPTTFVREVEL
jgi:hypothetical protein